MCVEPTFASKPVRPFLGSRFPFRLPPSPVHTVSIGTGFTAGLGWYGGLAAVPADPEFPGLPPVFLGAEPILFLAVRGRTPLSLGIDLLLVLGSGLCWSRRGAGLLRSFSLSGGFPGFSPACFALLGGLPPALLGFGNVMVNVRVRPTAQLCGDRPSGLNSGQLRGGSPPTENTFMEQLPQRGSVPQIGVFHTPRLCNKQAPGRKGPALVKLTILVVG